MARCVVGAEGEAWPALRARYRLGRDLSFGEERGVASAADGYPLAVTRFPAHGEAWATILVAPAMGVRQDFYASFARFLAESGIHALTFDYRGMGDSRRGSLRGFEASVMDWGLKDLDAMLAEARAPAPQLPLLFAGHSLGGQLLGALPRRNEIAAALTVTAGSGYYRLNERMRLEVRIFWFAAVPLLTPLFGYFPGKRLRMVGDLPAGVARQWRSWCLHPEYLLAEGEALRATFASFAAPILSFSFEDDPIISRRAVESLNGFFSGARVEHRHLAAGSPPVGHFGFFAERSRDRLWRPAVSWLREHSAPAL